MGEEENLENKRKHNMRSPSYYADIEDRQKRDRHMQLTHREAAATRLIMSLRFIALELLITELNASMVSEGAGPAVSRSESLLEVG
jgi:hypothetical protein